MESSNSRGAKNAAALLCSLSIWEDGGAALPRRTQDAVQPLFGPENPVASVPQTRNNVTMLIEVVVYGTAVDVHIRVVLL